MKNNYESLYQPKRQSPVAIFMFIYTFLRRFIRLVFPLIIILFMGNRDKGSILDASIGGVAVVISAYTLIMSILSYFRYYYFLDEDGLNIHSGVLSRKKLNIPFERIQNINFEQKIIHQFFNVVSLEIDTAGSSKSEIKIEALPKSEAEAIRDFILEKKKNIIAESGEDAVELQEEIKEPDQLLLSLNPFDLMKVGVSQNHIRTAFIIMGIGFSFMSQIEDALDLDVVDIATENVEKVGSGFFPAFILVFIFFLFISFFVTLIRTVLKHFNLKFFKSKEGYKLTSGLITRQEVALRKEKVQIIKWSDNPIRRLFKIFTLEIKQAAAGVGRRRGQSVEVPGCYKNQVDEVVQSCFPEILNDSFKEHELHYAYVIRRFIYQGLLPAAIMAVIYAISYKMNFLILAIVIPFLSFALLTVYYRKYRWMVGEEFLKIKKGIFSISYSLLPYYKIQAVEIIQTIYQRRKGLANLQIFTAGGSVTIPYIELEKSETLRNYILFKVESSKRTWM